MQLTLRRGQAFMETMIFVPVFLIILYGIIWIVQTTVVNERLQFAVRYSGLIDNTASPYSAWSLYAMYENAEYPTSTTAATRTCFTPAPQVLSNASPFPGPTAAPFWQPSSVSNSSCTTTLVTMNLTLPALFNNSTSAMQATTTVPGYLKFFGNTLSAQQKFFGAPDLRAMFTCFSALKADASGSLTAQGGSQLIPPTPMPSTPTGAAFSSSC